MFDFGFDTLCVWKRIYLVQTDMNNIDVSRFLLVQNEIKRWMK